MNPRTLFVTALLGPVVSFAAENIDSQTFVMEAALAGHAEVELGRLAQEKGATPDVRKFGQQMVEDHGKANSELAGIAKARGLSVPTTPGPDHEAVLTALQGEKGPAFDSAYIEQMAKDHDKAAALFEAAAGLEDPELSAFARKTLPTLRRHREMVDTVHVNHP